MLVDYMDLAGVEIVNSARAVAYARGRGLPVECDPCVDIVAAVGDMPYLNPVGDEAPWYDTAIPESANFLGVLGDSVAGFDSSPVSREPIQLIGDGAEIGPVRRKHREIGYTVLLLAMDECALSYGLEWLSSALQGSACGVGKCSSDEMCVFSCCPADGERELRHLYDVGLLDGLQVTDKRFFSSGAVVATVSFSLVAGTPWIYREPLATRSGDWVSIGSGEVVPNFDPDQVYAECIAAKPCLEDPWCPKRSLPPLPPIPVDPCYRTGLSDFRRTRLQVSPLEQPGWLETVPVLELRTGSTEMRRLVVRFWANPQNNPCGQFIDPCDACTDVNISYLPTGSSLIVDGRIQRSVVECPQKPFGMATTTPTIYGPHGSNFQYPVFKCPTGLCVEVWSELEFTAPDAEVRVSLVPRSDMG